MEMNKEPQGSHLARKILGVRFMLTQCLPLLPEGCAVSISKSMRAKSRLLPDVSKEALIPF